MTNADGLVEIGRMGPLFKLREPHTPESLRADAARSKASPSRLCRWLGHRKAEVGLPYRGEDEDDPLEATLAELRSSEVSALLRCGAVSIKRRL